MYRVMKFNNFALPKEVGEGWGCVFRGGGNPKRLDAPPPPQNATTLYTPPLPSRLST